MAVVLLTTLAGVLAWGTFYEARFGTAAVQRFIYHSGWFQALLGFLALNLAVAALTRFPWKRKQLPFLLAHVGIILILIGGIVGGRLGVEGQMVIPEGESSSRIESPQKLLVIHQPNPGVHEVFPTFFEARAWDHEPNARFKFPVKDRIVWLTVDRYHPNAAVREEVTPGDADNPAVRLTLWRDGEPAEVWLFARDPDRYGAEWQGAHLFFLAPESPEEWKRLLYPPRQEKSDRGSVSIRFLDLGATRTIPIPKRLGESLSIPGTPYRILFKQIFTDFGLTAQGPINRSKEPNNPAVAFLLTGPEGTDARLAFARYPDFEALHGHPQKIRTQVHYLFSSSRDWPPNSFLLIRSVSGHAGQAGELSAVLTGESPQPPRIVSPIQIGTRYVHSALGFEFQVQALLPRAQLVQEVISRGDEIQAERLHVRASDGQTEAEGWLALGEPVQLPLSEKDPLLVEYRRDEWELPFTVKLLDFRKTDYPGTQIPASFESDVELADPDRGVTLKRKISMNHPLKYRGFSLFQSSYIPGPVEATVLSVRNDPGTPLVYTGFLIVILGVVSMFLFREESRRASPRQGMFHPLILLMALCVMATGADVPSEALGTIRHLSIQHNGRVKPFDSFAWETLKYVTGNSRYGREIPVKTVLSMAAEPERWQEIPIILVPYGPLREPLGLDRKTAHVSYSDLVAGRKLMRMLPSIVEKQSRQEKLSILENETMDVYSRFVTLSSLFQAEFHLVPPSSVGRGESASRDLVSWQPILDPSGYPEERRTAVRDGWIGLIELFRRGDGLGVGASSQRLAKVLQGLNPSVYPAGWRLHLEVLYNDLSPFKIAQIFYAISILGLGLGGLHLQKPSLWSSMGKGSLWIGFLLHGIGIGIRVILGGRPPVSNFYETMLWLPFVAVGLSLIFERIYRSRFFGLAAGILAAIFLLLADHLPLDPSISPVVAVLRSNLWLTVHVLTIVASYGALGVAAVLAHLYGGIFLYEEGPTPSLEALETFLYRTIQVGVVLLASGIMLGGIWANASWGRYWGWDPKETWALITLLWFLAILHGRFAGWLKGVGVAIGTMAGFFLLLMTYYGVSFYLVGLHSYAGGHAKPLPPLLVGYLVAETAFMATLGWVGFHRRTPIHI